MNIFYDSDFEDTIATVLVFVGIGFAAYWGINKLTNVERSVELQRCDKICYPNRTVGYRDNHCACDARIILKDSK